MSKTNSNLFIFVIGILFQGLIIYAEVNQLNYYINGKIVYGRVVDVGQNRKNKLIYYINNNKIEKMVKLKENTNIKLICIAGSKRYMVYKISNFILTDLLRLLVFVGMVYFLKHFYKNELCPSFHTPVAERL